MDEKDCVKEQTGKKVKNWGNGGGLYRGVKASVKTLNYIIIGLVAALIVVVIYLSSTSSYTTSFEVNGGEPIKEVHNKYGDVVEVTTPTKTGYEFGGWYQDQDLTKSWDLQKDTVEGSITLYAKWTPSKIHVMFDLNGGAVNDEDVSGRDVVFHEPYGALPTPEKDGATFIGWQYDGMMITKDTLVTMNGEHTLKAIFE